MAELNVKNTAQMLKALEQERETLRRTINSLTAAVELWTNTGTRLIPLRMGTSARSAGVKDSVVTEYVSGMDSWMLRMAEQLANAKESLKSAQSDLDALEHCVHALRHRANRARAERAEGFVV